MGLQETCTATRLVYIKRIHPLHWVHPLHSVPRRPLCIPSVVLFLVLVTGYFLDCFFVCNKEQWATLERFLMCLVMAEEAFRLFQLHCGPMKPDISTRNTSPLTTKFRTCLSLGGCTVSPDIFCHSFERGSSADRIWLLGAFCLFSFVGAAAVMAIHSVNRTGRGCMTC